jgi:predicted MFS family arabinose efflux permease
MTPGRRLRELVMPLRHRDFRLVWIAQVLSELGDWAARLALAILVLERTDSTALSTFIFTVSLLPSVGIGPYLAALGDRYPRRRLLVVSDLVRAALFGVMILPVPTWALFPLLFMASTATPPFEAVRSALVPSLVPAHDYPRAIQLSAVTLQSALLVGYASGGALVALIGPRGTLAVNAGSFVASAIALSFLTAGRTAGERSGTAGQSLRRGVEFILADALVRRTVVLMCLVAAAAIVAETLVPAYTEDVLGRGARTAGLLSAAVPLGTIGVAAVFHHDPDHLDPVRRIATVASVWAVAAAAVFAMDPGVPWIGAGFLAVGAVFGAVLPGNAIFGMRVPDELRASAFGVMHAALLVAQALGALLGGVVAQFAGPRATCVGALAVALVVAAPELIRGSSERLR